MQKRARVIYNPTSGREIIKKNLADVLNILENAGYVTSSHATTPEENDAKNEARKAVENRYDLVVAAGGDGTINEVINGIAEQEYRPKIGIIPTGTTNDFARALKIPRDVIKATEIIANGESIAMDIGKANDTYFINIGGGGRITELTYDVPSRLKTMLGQLAYYLKGIEMLPSLKATRVRVEYDDGVFEGEAMFFLLGLTNSIGGFEKIAPDAKLDDGKFSLILVKKVNLAEFIRLVTLALRGDHIKEPNVIYVKSEKVTVFSDDQMLINLDGELGGETPMTFQNLKQHISFFANVADIPASDLNNKQVEMID
ncbi:diacylglycerol kinase [Listeria riparia]|uniref:Lipid kinase n=1 Tax=Listeria riparia FSL S10-1204 TaxID=1265816 RepID=W7CS77_9LIST|nr:diacylglycerol kinase [Listeria riparia]EUJ42509.1 lipid kinase [Listeria riparia FSL S10-1204]